MVCKTLYLLIFASVVYVQVALSSHMIKRDLGAESRQHNGLGLPNIFEWVTDLPTLLNIPRLLKDLHMILRNNTHRLNDIDDSITELSSTISLETNVTKVIRNTERSLRSEIIKLGQKIDRCCFKKGGNPHRYQNTLNNKEEEENEEEEEENGEEEEE